MEWREALSSDAGEVEKDEELLERLYNFFLQTDLPEQDSPDFALVDDKSSLFKLVSLLRSVARVKGLEAQAAEDELADLQDKYDSATVKVGSSERDLLNQVVQLERDLRQRDHAIHQLKQQADVPPPSVASEVRYLRDQVDSLQHRSESLQRSLDHERQESERAAGELASEKQRGREREREIERLQQNVEDYRRQLESSTDRRLEVTNYRDLIGQREDEIRRQIDKIEELVEERDNLEKQLSQVTSLLGQVEEKRLSTMKDMENMKTALSEADLRSQELEHRNDLLEGQVNDLQERLQLQSGADEHIMTLVSSKAGQWESTLAAKQVELDDCKKKMVFLEEQLRVAQRQTDRATLLKLKKQVQEKDVALSSLRDELSRAVEQVDLLTSQLDEARRKSDPARVNAQLKQELDQSKGQVETLESELRAETRRREEAELHVEERDADLASAFARLGEYERGEYGLYEAVQEIKMKKDELAVRDSDIAELTQQVNQLDTQLNLLSEENESLRDRCGLTADEQVDVEPVRARRNTELDRLKKDNQHLQQQLRQTEEEKLIIRKQLIEQRCKSGSGDGGGEEGVGGAPGVSGDLESSGDGRTMAELKRSVQGSEQRFEAERRQAELLQREKDALKRQLDHSREQVSRYEEAVKELSSQMVAKSEKNLGDNSLDFQAIKRLIAMLEAQSVQLSGSKYDVTLQLKSEVSQLTGQNNELRSRLTSCERELVTAIKQVERRECEVEGLRRETAELRKVRAGFHALVLPEGLPPTSSDVITRLNEHLLNVLSQLHRKEAELGQAQEALEKFQRKFSVIIHQQGILYTEYSEARKGWEEEKERLTHSKDELAASLERDQVRVRELANLQESLSSSESVQKKRLAEVSRKVTLLQVNEKTLSRRYTLLLESEASLRKENDRLRADMLTLEKAITERMGYLQRHKEASLFKLSSLQHQLSESVPKQALEKANQEYSELVIKYQQCLQKQTAYAADTSAMEHLQVEVRTLSEQLDTTRQNLAAEKQKNGLLEQQLVQLQTSGRGSSRGAGSDVGGAMAERVATIEMKEMSERQRADLASVRCKQFQETLRQLEDRNSSLELKFSELTQKLLQSQAKEVDLRDQLASALPVAERTSLQGEIEELKKREAELRLQNSQLQEVAEVSRQQVAAMETKRKSHDIELSSLRHQLLDVQMQSEEKSVIGKLHHQVVALQVSESTAVHRAEEQSAKVMRLEAVLLRIEQERDGLSERLFHSRAEAHKRTKHLRTTVQTLRRHLAGALPLSEQERHSHLLQKLREDKKTAEEMRECARVDQEKVQDKLAELELQHSNLQELLGVLREQSRGTSSTATKLTEWHAKLGELRMREAKVARTNERLQQRIKHLEDLMAGGERSVAKLEQELVQVTKDHESCQISWEQREAELEEKVERFQREHSSIISAASEMDAAFGGAPDPKLPVASQLEQALTRLRDNGRTMAELREKHKESVAEADRMEKALGRAQGELIRREKEISQMRMDMARLQQTANQEVLSEREELKRALDSAQNSIEDLKSEVYQKEELADKYQRLLREARLELHSAADAHKAEIASLTAKLHSQADSALSRLKEAALEAVNPPRPLHPTNAQLDRLRELEELTEEQEKVNEKMRRELLQVRQESEQDKQVSKTRLTRLQDELKDTKSRHQKEMSELHSCLEEKACRVVELEQELEVMEGELSAAQQAAKQAPSRTMKALVERLRNQLAMKEKQQRALSQAVLQLRADLVDTAQRTLEGEAERETQETNIKELVEKRTQQLKTQLADLGCELEEVRGQLSESQARETNALEELAKMEGEVAEKTSLVGRLEAELRQLRKTVDQAKAREQKLTRELQEVHLKAEMRTDTEELQKRVKILQGKLDKQKQLTREYETALKSHKPQVGGASGMGQPLIDSKHHTVEVLKWEESKKWQRKVETVRMRLSEKHKEVEAAKRQINSLKEMLSRSDREKSIIQGKLRVAQRNIIESSGRPQLSSGQGKENEATPTTSADVTTLSNEEKHQLKSRIYHLENEVQKLEHRLKVDKDLEQFELSARCERLSSTVKSLEAQLRQQVGGASRSLTESGEVKGHQQLDELLSRGREIEEELLKCHKENIRLKFEYEQAVVELPRLKAQVKDQQEYIELLSVHQDGNVRTTPTAKKASSEHHSVAELERVVAAMRKVVERLQSENNSLKKSLAVAKSRKSGQRDKTALEEENNRLKADLERLQAGVVVEGGDHKQSSTSLKSPYLKIVNENERLRKELKKELERTEKLQLTLTTMELRNDKLQKEVAELSHDQSHDMQLKSRDYEERMERFQVELEKKTSMLMEVRRHLHEAVEREKQLKSVSLDQQLSHKYLALVTENEHLQQQLAKMQKELDAFDPSFFEELEDLKYNYQEAVKRNVQYEERLNSLARQYGFTLDT